MKISEKQIMQLIQVARDSRQLALDFGDNWHGWALMVAKLLDEINNQQSEELKVIE